MSRRVVLIGAVHESLAAFSAIHQHQDADLVGVVTMADELAETTFGMVDLGGLAESFGIPVLRVRNTNDAPAVSAIAALEPDLLAVVGWTRLISEELLRVPRRGAIGFHASLLPRNRGRAPVNWAIIRGEAETGNTMMKLSAGVDTGDIIDQRSTPILPDDTCATVYERVATLGADMLTAHIGPILRGTAPTRRQSGDANVLPKRVPEMGVTDWDRPAQDVHNWIRAQTLPYPGAFTHLNGERVYLWASHSPGARLPEDAEPGQLLEAGSVVRVATAGGSVVVTELSTRDRSPMPAGEWARIHNVTAGQRFDAPSPAASAWALGLGPRPVAECRP